MIASVALLALTIGVSSPPDAQETSLLRLIRSAQVTKEIGSDAKHREIVGAWRKLADNGVKTPSDLYTLLTGHGYWVDIIRKDGKCNLVFLVAARGADRGYVLVVDGRYGQVLTRKTIALADYGYADRYPVANRDDCDEAHSPGARRAYAADEIPPAPSS